MFTWGVEEEEETMSSRGGKGEDKEELEEGCSTLTIVAT